jgi:hypothetical protein
MAFDSNNPSEAIGTFKQSNNGKLIDCHRGLNVSFILLMMQLNHVQSAYILLIANKRFRTQPRIAIHPLRPLSSSSGLLRPTIPVKLSSGAEYYHFSARRFVLFKHIKLSLGLHL